MDAYSFLSQPTFGTLFGPEHFDRTGRVCGVWNTAKCRRAEVALYSVANVDLFVGEASRYAHGEIARPTASVPGTNGIYSTTQIDTANPLIVVGTHEHPIQGEVVHRIGMKSGWQYGAVTETCSDRPVASSLLFNNRILVCQSVAHTNSQPGDSGGPVFILLAGGNQVLFAGLNWGAPSGTTTLGIFSSTRQIRSEMYHAEFRFFPAAPPLPPGSSFSATVSGAVVVPPSVTCSYYGSANIADAEYLWIVDGVAVGTGTRLNWTSGYTQFVLVLEAIGQNAEFATTTLTVNVDSNAGMCYDQ